MVRINYFHPFGIKSKHTFNNVVKDACMKTVVDGASS